MQNERRMPPVRAEVRRPHLSARRKAGMEIASMRIVERPEARKDAVFEARPACAKRMGAYWDMLGRFGDSGGEDVHIKLHQYRTIESYPARITPE